MKEKSKGNCGTGESVQTSCAWGGGVWEDGRGREKRGGREKSSEAMMADEKRRSEKKDEKTKKGKRER